MDITDSLFEFLRQENTTTKKESSAPSFGKDINEVTGILMKAFKEADDKPEEPAPKMDDFDWDSINFDNDDEEQNDENPTEEQQNDDEAVEQTEETEEVENTEQDVADDEVQESENEQDEEQYEEQDDEQNDEQDEEQDDEQDEDDENASNEDKQDGELIGEFSEIKDEIEAHRENLSEIYERLFKNVISPLFRKLQDFNLNVAFDTTELLSHGIVKIKLSHMNIKSSAKMEINIFANTVNGEFLGLENKNGEVISTDLNDVSLDDLINILIKVLA